MKGKVTTTDNQRRAADIQESIRQVLFSEWDPIGVNDSAPDGEYDSYIGGIYRLLASGANKDVVADHLRKLEIERMEMPTSSEHRSLIAAKLLALDVSLENQK